MAIEFAEAKPHNAQTTARRSSVEQIAFMGSVSPRKGGIVPLKGKEVLSDLSCRPLIARRES